MSRLLQPRECFWLLALPAYVVIGTVRHEASHALVGTMLGGHIERFVFLPSARFWGMVRFAAPQPPPLPTYAAPYVFDVLFLLACAWLCFRIPARLRQLWLNVVVLGVVSPVVDSTYNYVKAFIRGGDVATLFQLVPWYLVHLWFIAFAAAGTVTIVKLLRHSPAALASLATPRASQGEPAPTR